MSLEVVWTQLDDLAVAPEKAHVDDAGWDLTLTETVTISAMDSVLVQTGIAIAMPPGWWARIVGRSSTWRKRNLIVQEGIIDAGYRGELLVGLWNPTMKPQTVWVGERLAQMLFLPVPTVHWSERPSLPESERGDNGFGSSGT